MNELQAILDSSPATNEQKLKALELAFRIAGPIASNGSAGAAGGEFFKLLMEIIKMLLPLLLKLLGGG